MADPLTAVRSRSRPADGSGSPAGRRYPQIGSVEPQRNAAGRPAAAYVAQARPGRGTRRPAAIQTQSPRPSSASRSCRTSVSTRATAHRAVPRATAATSSVSNGSGSGRRGAGTGTGYVWHPAHGRDGPCPARRTNCSRGSHVEDSVRNEHHHRATRPAPGRRIGPGPVLPRSPNAARPSRVRSAVALVTFFTMAYIVVLNPLIIGTVPDADGQLPRRRRRPEPRAGRRGDRSGRRRADDPDGRRRRTSRWRWPPDWA